MHMYNFIGSDDDVRAHMVHSVRKLESVMQFSLFI